MNQNGANIIEIFRNPVERKAKREGYDEVRKGARLVLSYDVQSNSFNGTVENTTDEILERVRVEVHLSRGIELGPTIPTDLKPGEKRAVKLNATDSDFERWSAHAESGSSEPGHSGEGEEGEHSGEGEEGEHSSERDEEFHSVAWCNDKNGN